MPVPLAQLRWWQPHRGPEHDLYATSIFVMGKLDKGDRPVEDLSSMEALAFCE